MFNLLEKENIGTIELLNKVRISDPCYDLDTWCAGTLDNVLPGEYNCYSQKADTGNWGVRVASIEVRHCDYTEVEPTEVTNIDVGVDSGQAGIYDLDYFARNREDKSGEDKWYWRVCDATYYAIKNPNYVPFEESEFWKDEFKEFKEFTDNCGLDNLEQLTIILKQLEHTELTEKEIDYLKRKAKFDHIDLEYSIEHCKYLENKCSNETIMMLGANILDEKCLVSSSGDGDGSYTCLVGRNEEGKIVSIKVDYYYYDEELEDEE